MTKWQWKVILALCRIILSAQYSIGFRTWVLSIKDEDYRILQEAINRGDDE